MSDALADTLIPGLKSVNGYVGHLSAKWILVFVYDLLFKTDIYTRRSEMKLCGRASAHGVMGRQINPSWWTH